MNEPWLFGVFLLNPLWVDYFVWLVSQATFNADVSIVYFLSVAVLLLLLYIAVSYVKICNGQLFSCHHHQIISVGSFIFWRWNRVSILRHILFQSSNDVFLFVVFQPFIFIDVGRLREEVNTMDECRIACDQKTNSSENGVHSIRFLFETMKCHVYYT